MIDLSMTEFSLGLLLTLRRLAASLAVDRKNPDRLGNDDAEAITSAAAALTTAVEKLKLMPGGAELAVIILNAAEELAARAPLDETRRRAYAPPIQREKSSTGGKARADNYARAEEETLHPHVIELASDVLAKNPKLSTARLAVRVHDLWRLNDKPPAERTLRRLISAMRKSGRLPESPPKLELASNRLTVSKRKPALG